MVQAVARTGRRRAGFTLIELLVVVAIIAVLASLSTVAVMRMMGTQLNANTKSELSRLEAAFKKAYRAAADKYAKEPIPNSLQSNYSTVSANAGNDRLRAQVIWTKLRLRQAFPMTFSEALNPAPLPPLSYYTNTLGQYGYTAANVNPTPAANSPESSICLLLALQRGEDGPGLHAEDLGGSSFFKTVPVTLKSGAAGQPMNAMIDGWGNPLFFVRWPVYLNAATTKNPTNYGLTGQPVAGFNDADDPTGLLASTTWQGTSGYTWFTSSVHGLAPHASGAPQTYRIFPIIASGGPNNVLGFNPYAVTVAGSPAGSIDADDLLATLAVPQ